MNPIPLRDGTQVYAPTTALSISIPGQSAVISVDADKAVAVIGEAEGGIQNSVYAFRSVLDAEQVLRAGPALDAIKVGAKTFPSVLYFVNTRGGTAATAILKDTAVANFGTLTTLKTRDRANQTAYTLGVQSNGGFSFSLIDNDAGGVGFSDVNIGLGFAMTYTAKFTLTQTATVNTATTVNVSSITAALTSGQVLTFTDGITSVNVTTSAIAAATTSPAVIAVVSGGASVTAGMVCTYTPAAIGTISGGVLTTTVAAYPSHNQSIPLSAGTNITSLCAKLNSTGVYLALKSREGGLDVSTLDAVASVDLRQATPIHFKALKGDFANFFATKGAGYVTWVQAASVLTPVAVSGYFAGGTSTAATVTDYSNAHAALNVKSFAFIVPLVDNQSVRDGTVSAVQSRNAPRVSSFTQAILGGAEADLPASDTLANVNTYLTTAEQKIASINNEYVTYVVSSKSVVDPVTGFIRKAKLYEVALEVACYIAAGDLSESITGKTFGGSNPYPTFDGPSGQRDRVVQIGGLAFERVGETGVACLAGRTTWIGEPNKVKESLTQTAITLSIARGIRARMSVTNGKKATQKILSAFSQSVKDYLKLKESAEWLVIGTDVNTGELLPAWDFQLLPPQYGSSYIPLKVRLSPVSEIRVTDGILTATSVNIQIGA
jgi:hypothetical protein